MIDSVHHVEKTKEMHNVLRQIPYNLFAVGVGRVDQEANAFMGSWITQCSFEPPMMAVAIRRDTLSFRMAETEGIFTINLLRKDQDDIARKLVKPHHRVGNKLADVDHTAGVTGAPILTDSIGFIECKEVSQVSTGDHVILVGEVVNALQSSTEQPMSCTDIGWHYGG